MDKCNVQTTIKNNVLDLKKEGRIPETTPFKRDKRNNSAAELAP